MIQRRAVRYLPDLGLSLPMTPTKTDLARARAVGLRRLDALDAFLKANDDLVALGVVDDLHLWPVRCDVKKLADSIRALLLWLERGALVDPMPITDVHEDLFSTAPPPVQPLPRSSP